MLMTQTLRWFGPDDPVSLRDIRQTGATGVVTALHEVRNGAVWEQDAITARKATIRMAGAGLVGGREPADRGGVEDTLDRMGPADR